MPGKTGDHAVTRFLRKIRVADIAGDGCWHWEGAVQENGYGRFNADGKPTGAHRAAYSLFIGEIPSGADVCHACDNRRCVRPDHLFVGSRSDNMADALKKGRLSRGEKHAHAVLNGVRIPAAKLSPDHVRTISARLTAGHKPSAIAEDFGVTQHAIIAIQRGRTWTHITGLNNVR